MIAIGVIDTRGYVSTVEALDVCLKTANVQLVTCEMITGGIVSSTITGDVAAVTAAVQAGVAAAERIGGYLNHTVIARIDEQTGLLYEEAPVAPKPEPEPEPQPKPKPAAQKSEPKPKQKPAAQKPEPKPEPEPEQDSA